jgi:hypothetical protein
VLLTKGVPPGGGSYHYNFGSYKIAKSSSKDNFSTWEEICDLKNLYTWDVSYGSEVEPILKDYNVE